MTKKPDGTKRARKSKAEDATASAGDPGAVAADIDLAEKIKDVAGLAEMAGEGALAERLTALEKRARDAKPEALAAIVAELSELVGAPGVAELFAKIAETPELVREPEVAGALTKMGEQGAEMLSLVPPENGLGERLRAAREASHLSLEALSRFTKLSDPEGRGVSRPVLGGYEKGDFKPGTRELRVLYQALGVTPNWLVLGESDPCKKGAIRASYETDEAFYSHLLDAIKRMDVETQDGLADLVFKAAITGQELRKHTDTLARITGEAGALASAVLDKWEQTPKEAPKKKESE